MGKWLVRILLLGIVFMFAVGVFAFLYLQSAKPPEASYAIQAYCVERSGVKIPTRYFYSNDIEIVDGVAVLTGYWSYDGRRYIKHDGVKEIEPPFDISRRCNDD